MIRIFFGSPDHIEKDPGQPINSLSLSRHHLRWMKIGLRCHCLRNLVLKERLKRRSSFNVISLQGWLHLRALFSFAGPLHFLKRRSLLQPQQPVLIIYHCKTTSGTYPPPQHNVEIICCGTFRKTANKHPYKPSVISLMEKSCVGTGCPPSIFARQPGSTRQASDIARLDRSAVKDGVKVGLVRDQNCRLQATCLITFA